MRTVQSLREHRATALGLVDSLAWAAGFVVASVLRLDTLRLSASWGLRDTGGAIPLSGVAMIAAGTIAVHLALSGVLRLHQGRARLGSFDEMLMLGMVAVSAGLVATVGNLLLPAPLLPRSVPIGATFVALIVMCWVRALYRRWHESSTMAARDGRDPTPVLVVGAGDGGRQLVESMARDARHVWRAVGFLDDDRLKRHLRVRGVPVLGRIDEMADAARDTGAEAIVIAVPSASSKFVLRVSRRARALGLDVKVLPGLNELVDRVGIADLRDIRLAEVLGRRQIETDVDSIAHTLAGRRVLVTGAGGSIGSELCAQLCRFGPAELVLLDRDESALHALQLALYGSADLDAPDAVLADVRDDVHLGKIFAARRPQVVFHAAALKHVNMLERFPGEAVKTNVHGTANVLAASIAVGVERFVNVSTDKAADPCNVLGWTKRIAEGLTADAARRTPGAYLSVRFGNVLGSRGSVLTTFAAQIAAGGPVTVTDPAVTRYFMTIEEAVQLLIQAAAIGEDGEALVLDMGEPVRIADVAVQLIDQADRPIDVVFTGLKPGEKLHEVLLGDGEPDVRGDHPLISHVPVAPVARSSVDGLRDDRSERDWVEALEAACRAMRRSPATQSAVAR